jgi:hypothetical protein
MGQVANGVMLERQAVMQLLFGLVVVRGEMMDCHSSADETKFERGTLCADGRPAELACSGGAGDSWWAGTLPTFDLLLALNSVLGSDVLSESRV